MDIDSNNVRPCKMRRVDYSNTVINNIGKTICDDGNSMR